MLNPQPVFTGGPLLGVPRLHEPMGDGRGLLRRQIGARREQRRVLSGRLVAIRRDAQHGAKFRHAVVDAHGVGQPQEVDLPEHEGHDVEQDQEAKQRAHGKTDLDGDGLEQAADIGCLLRQHEVILEEVVEPEKVFEQEVEGRVDLLLDIEEGRLLLQGPPGDRHEAGGRLEGDPAVGGEVGLRPAMRV